MTLMRLTEGGLHEPSSSDWDDICVTVGPQTFFETLFREVGGLGLPAAEIADESEDDIQRVRKGKRGTEVMGARIEQRESKDRRLGSVSAEFGAASSASHPYSSRRDPPLPPSR
jgi:hypothetical protein